MNPPDTSSALPFDRPVDPDGSERARSLYRSIVAHRTRTLLLLAAACVLTTIIDISVGPSGLTLGEIVEALFAPADASPAAQVILWDLRLPTALLALAVGAALGIAGAEMQTILANPLASPYTLGVSAGAGFGAALAIVLGVGVLPFAGEYLVPVNAFAFALLTCLAIYFLGTIRGVSSETMILAGIALLFLFHSLLAFLQYLASEEALQAIVFWLFGSLAKATWPKVGMVAAVVAVVLPLLLRDCWKLTALKLGDERARSLGVHVERLRLRVFLTVSVLTAAAVCFVGTIGFVGLIAPHIARMLVGEDQRHFLPVAALCGALILSTASTASKLVIPGALFPIGILTSLMGIPFFLYLVIRGRRRYW